MASIGTKTTEEAIRVVDYTVYRNCLNINILKLVTAIIIAYGEDELQAQIHIFNCARFISLGNNFKYMPHTWINAQFQLAIMSIEEEKRFLAFISPDPWPTEMKATRTNLLQTKMLGKELLARSESDGFSELILPSLLELYRTRSPLTAPQKES